jgi:glycyl-tRNA synthetase
MNKRYEELYSLSLRRGFIWPSTEVYGGLAGFYDYGPLGALLKRNWEDSWLDFFLGLGNRHFLVDSTAIMAHDALKASGHVDLFSDLLVKCEKCGESYKADDLIGEVTGTSGEGLKGEELDAKVTSSNVRCPKCGGSLGKAKEFNMMFPVSIGSEGQDKGFLRPETAQGAYLMFKRGFEIARKKLPFGLASIGRAYRNEISPRQGVYRMRELIQAELQIFFDPANIDKALDFDSIEDYPLRVQFFGDDAIQELRCAEFLKKKDISKFFVYHMAMVQKFYLEIIKVPKERFRLLELGENEKAFYNKVHFDIEVHLESLDGFKELGGIHYRTDYDLSRHQTGSKERMEVSFEGKKLIPHVLELSFGIDRNVWALLDVFYEKGDRSVLRLQPFLAPYFAGVFPLVNKDGLDIKARDLYSSLRKEFKVFFDDSGSIGRRYARMDEIGTPFCITVDYDTKEDDSVTVRERDSTLQKRIPISNLEPALRGLLSGKKILKEM